MAETNIYSSQIKVSELQQLIKNSITSLSVYVADDNWNQEATLHRLYVAVTLTLTFFYHRWRMML